VRQRCLLLSASSLHFRYPRGPEVLKGASFTLARGEVVAIIGPNGSGKTTLLLVASGLLEPDSGEVLFEGSPLKEQLPWVRRRIGFVFQDPDDQLFNPTVFDEMAFALRQILSSEAEVRRRVEELARRLKLSHLLERPPFKLSVGEKRRLALASVLTYDPDLLILDEPTANLSSRSVEEVVEVVREARGASKGVLVSSHDVEFVASVADRVYVLSGGRLHGGLSAREVLTDEALLSLADMSPPAALRAAEALGLRLKRPPLTVEELKEAREDACRLLAAQPKR